MESERANQTGADGGISPRERMNGSGCGALGN
jgi:hypothetical protein